MDRHSCTIQSLCAGECLQALKPRMDSLYRSTSSRLQSTKASRIRDASKTTEKCLLRHHQFAPRLSMHTNGPFVRTANLDDRLPPRSGHLFHRCPWIVAGTWQVCQANSLQLPAKICPFTQRIQCRSRDLPRDLIVAIDAYIAEPRAVNEQSK